MDVQIGWRESNGKCFLKEEKTAFEMGPRFRFSFVALSEVGPFQGKSLPVNVSSSSSLGHAEKVCRRQVAFRRRRRGLLEMRLGEENDRHLLSREGL